MEEEDKEKSAEKGEKKHKKRQKKILADLKQQIEFYFSEPNLEKDRFLRQKMLEHPQGCVEIATIASFNRMMQLCDDVALVVKAMKMCPSVEVIDDQWVKPSKPLSRNPKNVDSVTVYVEKLPPHVDHDWVKSLFSSCGKVVYVSLPRHKSTRDIKGFAFVEFENESEAKQALELFDQEKKPVKEEAGGNDGGEENIDEPREKQGKKNRKRKQKLSESENEDGKAKGRKLKHKREEEKNALISDLSDNSSTTLKKRKRSNMDKEAASDEKESRIKLKKIGETRSELSESDGDSVSAGAKRKKEINEENESDPISIKKAKNNSESDDKDLMPVDNNAEKKHKKRKRKRKEKKETDVPNLKVISKIEWLRLKQEYQKLQREAMTETKTNLKKNQEHLMQTETSCKENPVFPEDGIKMEATDNAELQSVSAKLPAKLEMQPGVVLKYFTKEANDKQNLRDLFSAIAPVSYLEKQVDQEMGFVRFSTKEGCHKVLEAVKNGSMETIKVEELTEKEDAEYWEKLNKDRLERLQQQKQRKKQRGTQKIADKIEAQSKRKDHIHFDE